MYTLVYQTLDLIASKKYVVSYICSVGKVIVTFKTSCFLALKICMSVCLLFILFANRRLQQASSVDDQGKDKDASFRDDATEVTILLSGTKLMGLYGI